MQSPGIHFWSCSAQMGIFRSNTHSSTPPKSIHSSYLTTHIILLLLSDDDTVRWLNPRYEIEVMSSTHMLLQQVVCVKSFVTFWTLECSYTCSRDSSSLKVLLWLRCIQPAWDRTPDGSKLPRCFQSFKQIPQIPILGDLRANKWCQS